MSIVINVNYSKKLFPFPQAPIWFGGRVSYSSVLFCSFYALDNAHTLLTPNTDPIRHH